MGPRRVRHELPATGAQMSRSEVYLVFAPSDLASLGHLPRQAERGHMKEDPRSQAPGPKSWDPKSEVRKPKTEVYLVHAPSDLASLGHLPRQAERGHMEAGTRPS